MKVLIVVCAVVAVSMAGYAPVPYGGYAAPAPIGADFFDAADVAQQNAAAEAQGAHAAAQGAAAAADGSRIIQGPQAGYAAPPAHYGYAPAAPVQLTSQGVPVEPLEVQAARAANAAAHHAAKSAHFG